MGCDIHLQVEHRDKVGKWHRVVLKRTCVKCHGQGCDAADCISGWVEESFFAQRNYDIFDKLAGVRPRGIMPQNTIAPRGFPADMDSATRAWFDANGGDHTPSWLTMAELLTQNIGVNDEFWNVWTLDMLKPDNTRIVFNFDN